jgi:hypothetical protein
MSAVLILMPSPTIGTSFLLGVSIVRRPATQEIRGCGSFSMPADLLAFVPRDLHPSPTNIKARLPTAICLYTH